MGDKHKLSDLSAASFVKVQNSFPAAPLSQLRPSFSAPPCFPVVRVKFMCSYGGLILPRPSDKKLRYVGGETRIFSVPRDISYADFLSRMTDVYGQGLTLKYQLPDEDLDALVSVCSDDDLENMMEECARVDSCLGLSKLRVFVFTSSELDATDLSNMGDTNTWEQRYVDAVNALLPEANFRSQNDFATADFCMNSEGDNAFARDSMNMQEKSLLFEEPHLDASFVPNRSPLLSDTCLSEHVETAISIPHTSDSTFIRKPAVTETAPEAALERFAKTMECSSSASSSTSSHHDLHRRSADSSQIPCSSMLPPKECTLDHKEENGASGGDQTCIAEDVIQVPISNGELQKREPLDLQNNRCELASGDWDSRSNNRLHTDLLCSKSDSQQKQLEAVWDPEQISSDNKVTGVDPQWRPPWNVGLNPSPIEDSASARKLFPAEAQPDRQQTSASVYKTGSSALSSPTKEKLVAAGKPCAFPVKGQIHKMSTTDQEFPTTLYDYDGSCAENATCHNSGHPSWSFLNPANTSFENLTHPHRLGNKVVDIADNHFDGLPGLSWSSTLPMPQIPSNFQTHENAVDAQALEESTPTANSTVAAQSENEQAHNSGHLHSQVELAASTAVRGDIPRLGRNMVLESMLSCRESDSLQAEIFMADMRTSISHGSPLDACQQGAEFRAIEKTEPAVAEIGVTQDSVTIKRETQGKSFALAQDLASSREQCTKISCHFDEDMDLDDAKSLERFGVIIPTTSNPAYALPSAMLGANWQSSFSQSQTVHHVFIENLSKEEQCLEGLPIENEVTDEDLNLEIEELDRFESLPDPTSNAAILAEQEAISQGLQTITNSDLEELRELGSGTFGTVYHGKWRGTDVAIKRIKSSCFSGRQSERERLIADFWREAYILGQLHHPNVVAFYGVVPDGPGGTLATVTEFMVNGSLKQVLQKKDRTLDRHKRLLIAMDAAFGMEYLHGKNVVHFDIKCENLLVNLRDTQRPICKVGDLGLSKVKQHTMVSGGVRGTLPWMAPELLNGTSSFVSEKVDVFSFGIVLWELLTGEEPYANMHYGAIIGGIVSNTLRPPIPKRCDPAWRSLMEKCWSAEPVDRPTFTEIAGSLRMMEASINARG